MKKIIVLIITVMSCISMHAELTASQKTDALAFAKSICGNGDYEYFYSSTFFSHTYPQNITRESVLIFADLEPATSWEHNCKYIYLSTSLDRYEVVDSMLPPADLTLRPLELLNRSASAMQLFRLPIYHANDGDAPGRTYAVIINGGLNRSSNHERYWNDCAFIYQTLRNTYDVPKSHIKVVYADGTDPTPDLQLSHSGELVNSPLDLDGDNVDDIQYSATKANLHTVFQDLGNTITDEDHLFVFVTGHGSKSFTGNGSPSMYLWNNVKLYPNEFAEYLDMVDAQCISVVMGQCYSGAFINALHGNNRIITTACTDSESSYELPDIPFNSFLYNWTCAMNMANPLGNIIDSDQDSNGYISLNEAFSYANEHNLFLSENNRYRHQTPQLDYVAGVLYDDLSFDRMPETVDLYIRDDSRDTGKEPYPQQDLFKPKWNSPDLYLRMQDDGNVNNKHEMVYVEDPSTGEVEFYVYTNIHNRGTKAYNPNIDDRYIHLFATNTNGNINYRKFSGLELFDDEIGEQLSARKIGVAIEPGESALIKRHVVMDGDFENHPWDNHKLPISILGVISKARSINQDHSLIGIDTIVNKIRLSNNVAMRNESYIRFDPNDSQRVNIKDLTLYSSENSFVRVTSSNEHLKNIVSLHLPAGVHNYSIRRNNDTPSLQPSYRDVFINNIIPLQNVTEIINLNLESIQQPKALIELSQQNLFEFNQINEGDSLTILQYDGRTGTILAGITYIVEFDAVEETSSTNSMPQMTQIEITNDNKLVIHFSEFVSDAVISVTNGSNALHTMHHNIYDESISSTIDIPDDFSGILFIELKKDGKILDSKKIIK